MFQLVNSSFPTFSKKLLTTILLLLTLCLITACEKKTTYDDALEFSEGLAAMKTDGFYGYVDKNLDIVIKPEYYQAKSFHNGVALVKKASNWGAIDKNNKVVIPFKYTQLATFSKDLAVVNNYSKFGCIDYKGNVVIDFKYDRIELYTYYKETNTTIPSDYTFTLDSSYEKYTPYNYALTYLDNKIGFIDLQTNFTLEPKYSSISISPTDSTILSLTSLTDAGEMYGFADLATKIIVEPKFYYPLEFSEDLAAARNPDFSENYLELYGFIDKTGEYVIDPIYNYAGKFSNGLAPVEDFISTLNGYINIFNEYVIPATFSKALPFKNNCAIVKVSGKYTLINTLGEYITPNYFFDINFPLDDNFYDPTLGLALYKDKAKNYYHAVLNTSGEILFYTSYDYIGFFKEGISIVGQDNKYGCINQNGIEVIPLIYDSIFYTSIENILIVGNNKNYGVITAENEEILPLIYDSIEVKANNYLLLLKCNKYGFYNLENKILIEPTYDEIKFSFDSDILSVCQNKEWFFIDKSGAKLK